MARKPPLVGTVLPVGEIGAGAGALPGVNASSGVFIIGGSPDTVYIGTDDQSEYILARLTGPATAGPPRPRYTRTERHEKFSIVSWVGHDPYEMAVPIKFDKGGSTSVEADIRSLWRLLGGGQAAKPVEPPVVRVIGPVPHQTLRWRVESINEQDDRTVYLPNSDQRCRFACTVNLVQHVADQQLTLTNSAKGLRSRTARARRGEDLYDISKRMYGDRSHASDIARANGVGVGFAPPVGFKLRIP